MKPPYQTKCKEYDFYDKTTPQSKQDCVDRCLKKMFVEGCQCNPGHLFNRKDLSVGLIPMPLCNASNDAHLECYQNAISINCNDQCPDDCMSAYYTFVLFVGDSPTQPQIDEALGENKTQLLNDRDHTIKINLYKQMYGDITYTHVALMNVDLLFGTVGGLASLWCGVSLLSLSHSIKEMCVSIWNYLFGEDGKLVNYCFGKSKSKRSYENQD